VCVFVCANTPKQNINGSALQPLPEKTMQLRGASMPKTMANREAIGSIEMPALLNKQRLSHNAAVMRRL
jgi:hypothetical protein